MGDQTQVTTRRMMKICSDKINRKEASTTFSQKYQLYFYKIETKLYRKFVKRENVTEAVSVTDYIHVLNDPKKKNKKIVKKGRTIYLKTP